MKKKILALAMALVLCLSLASCGLGDKLTAFGLYSKAVKDFENAGGYEANATITMDMQILKISMDMNMKQNGKNSAIVTSMNGETISTVVTVDGVMYSDTAGYKVKSTIPAVDTEAVSDVLPDLASSLFDNIEIEEDGENKKITLNIDDETFSELMENSGSGDALGAASFKDAVMTMTFDKDDQLSEIYFSGTAEISESGVTMSMGFEMTQTIVNYGKAPTVTIPEDADEYIEGDITDIA